MTIWKQLVGTCMQSVKEPRNKVDKNAVTVDKNAVVRTDSHCK